jgi:hypothetical protein
MIAFPIHRVLLAAFFVLFPGVSGNTERIHRLRDREAIVVVVLSMLANVGLVDRLPVVDAVRFPCLRNLYTKWAMRK